MEKECPALLFWCVYIYLSGCVTLYVTFFDSTHESVTVFMTVSPLSLRYSNKGNDPNEDEIKTKKERGNQNEKTDTHSGVGLSSDNEHYAGLCYDGSR